MKFISKEFAKIFFHTSKKKVGYVIGRFPAPYDRVMASTRYRVYDVILSDYKPENFFLEIYKPWRKYDVLIFQKYFFGRAVRIAEKSSQKGAKIILDININVIDKDGLLKKERYLVDDFDRFMHFVDGIIVTTDYLSKKILEKYPHQDVCVIPEMLSQELFKSRKVFNSGKKRLIYMGHHSKVKDLCLIKKSLEKLYSMEKFEIIIITNKRTDLSLGEIPIIFKKYNHKRIGQLLLEGDVFLAPRDVSNAYNLGHSFTKIGYPMAVGLPILASPIPSYQGSPAIIIDELDSVWTEEILKFFRDRAYYGRVSKEGVDYCLKNYSEKEIMNKYFNFIKKVSLC